MPISAQSELIVMRAGVRCVCGCETSQLNASLRSVAKFATVVSLANVIKSQSALVEKPVTSGSVVDEALHSWKIS